MLIVSGSITVAPESYDAFLRLAGSVVNATREETGCEAYGMYPDPDELGRFEIIERWESDQALAEHMASAHFAEFMGALGGLKILGSSLTQYQVSDATKLI